MPKVQDPQMLTANRLKDGDVLYWKAGHWVLTMREGEVFADPKAADMALAEAQKYVTGNMVVNPYLFDVRVDGTGIHPVKEREIIRAAGPTVRGEGKQASDPKAREAERRAQRATSVEAKDDDVSI
ncbi:MAG TPA: DUF2849 domain-containing protein [Rhizomicrobium sp.]|nr:DUF2849 domain-containing protein [Rhizomicrobium sp.]